MLSWMRRPVVWMRSVAGTACRVSLLVILICCTAGADGLLTPVRAEEDTGNTTVGAPAGDAERDAGALPPLAVPAGGTATATAALGTSPIQATLLDGVNGQFRILLWLGLSASLSWTLTLFLYRRWFSPDRRRVRTAMVDTAGAEQPTAGATLPAPNRMLVMDDLLRRALHRLAAGLRRSTATAPVAAPATAPVAAPAVAPGEIRVRPPQMPTPLAAGDRAESMATAAAALADAAGQIAGQIEQLQRMAGLEPGASRSPGLFEPIAGDELDGDPSAEDDLYDVEPRGLLELRSARALHPSRSGAASATRPTHLRPAPGSGQGSDRNRIEQSGRFEGSDMFDDGDAFGANDAFAANDAFNTDDAFAANDAFNTDDTYDVSDGFDGDDPLTGLGLSAADLAEADLAETDLAEEDLLLEQLAEDECGLPLEEYDDVVRGDEDSAIGQAAGAVPLPDDVPTPRSIHPPARPRRALGLVELSEMVALGLGDGELAGGGED